MRIHLISDDELDVQAEVVIDPATGRVPSVRLIDPSDGHELLVITAANGSGVTATHLRQAQTFVAEAMLVSPPARPEAWDSPDLPAAAAELAPPAPAAAAPPVTVAAVATTRPARKQITKKAAARRGAPGGRPSRRPGDDARLAEALRGLSDQDAAARFGVAKTTIGNWRRDLEGKGHRARNST